MKTSHNIFFKQFKSYWKLEKFILKIKFIIEKKIFSINSGIRDESANFSSFRELINITKYQLIIALSISYLIQIANPLFKSIYVEYNLKILDDSNYITLFATISGICGVFIGLYYAGISAVGSSIYSKVPNNIRDLLAQERIGNVYMRFLAFLTFISLCLIGLNIIGFEPIVFAIPLAILMIGLGIISFVKLGQRAFYLFDPTRLSNSIFYDLFNLIKRVKVGGFKWTNSSFQFHAYKLARYQIDTLKILADITKKEKHLRGLPFVELTKNVLLFLINYQESKNKIPSDSRWYEQKYIHRDWYETEDTTVNFAQTTAITLQPEVSQNKDWIEEELFQIVLDGIDSNLNDERFDLVLQIINYFDRYLKTLSENGEVKIADEYLSKFTNHIFSIVAIEHDEMVFNEVLEIVALSERLGVLRISILLAFFNLLQNSNVEKISNKLKKINWSNKKSIYKNGFKSYLLNRLEWFQPGLLFETKSENKIISPNWYQTELILLVESDKIGENIRILTEESANSFSKLYKQLMNSGHPWFAAAMLSRELEYWNKLDFHYQFFNKYWSEINENKKIEGLSWYVLNLDLIEKAIDNRKTQMIRDMSKAMISLTMTSRPENFPDFGGQFLHKIGESLFESLLDKNVKVFKGNFKPYFYGCLNTFDRLKPKISSKTEWRDNYKLKIAVAPLLDLIALSGYSCVLSEFHNLPELYNEVTNLWDKYLETNKENNPLDLVSAAIRISDIDLEIAHRSILRSRWKQNMEGLFRNIPRKEITIEGTFGTHTIAMHDSSLVRMFARDRYPALYDGLDVFVSLYFLKFPYAKNLDFGRRSDFKERMQKEEEYYKKYNK